MIDLSKTKVVLVGVESYDDEELHALPAAFNGVAGLSSFFESSMQIPKKQIRRFVDVENKALFFKELREFTKRRCETLIFYYAGHGVQDDNRVNYYLTQKNFDYDLPEHTSIRVEELNELWAKNRKLKNVIVLIDACFSEMALDRVQRENYFLMASSAGTKTSKYPVDQEKSAFTGQLLEVLNNGIPNGKDNLCWDDVFEETSKLLLEKGFPGPRRASRGDSGQAPLLENHYFQNRIQTISLQKQLYTSLLGTSFCKFFNSETYPYPLAQFAQTLLETEENNNELYRLKQSYEQFIQFITTCALADQNAYAQTEWSAENPLHESCVKEFSMYLDSVKTGESFLPEMAEQAEQIKAILLVCEQAYALENAPIEFLHYNASALLMQFFFFKHYKLVALKELQCSALMGELGFRQVYAAIQGANLPKYQVVEQKEEGLGVTKQSEIYLVKAEKLDFGQINETQLMSLSPFFSDTCFEQPSRALSQVNLLTFETLPKLKEVVLEDG